MPQENPSLIQRWRFDPDVRIRLKGISLAGLKKFVQAKKEIPKHSLAEREDSDGRTKADPGPFFGWGK
jgi:hypothetical protein